MDHQGVSWLQGCQDLLEHFAIKGLAAGVLDMDGVTASGLQGLDLPGCVLLIG